MDSATELIVLLLAKAGGTAHFNQKELAAARQGWRLVRLTDPITGDVVLRLEEC